APVGDLAKTVRGDLRRGSCPSLYQLTLELVRIRFEHPIASLMRDVAVSEADQKSFSRCRRVRTECAAKPLVGSLMPVHQLANCSVCGVFRGKLDAAVVAEREQDRGPGIATPCNEGTQPRLGHQ